MSQETQWYVSQEGQQLGPYTDAQMVSFAQGGNINRQSLVWAEGMAEWLPAGQIGGLFPAAVGAAAPARGAATTARPAPGRAVATAHAAGPMRAGTATATRPGPTATQSGQATARGQVTQGHGGGEVFPRPAVATASFGLFAGAIGMGVALPLVGLLIMFQAAKMPEPDPAFGVIMLGCFVAGGLCLVMAQVFGLINLYRAWLCLSRTGASITPGMAVGLLFVPFFNVYWIFRAYYGFAQEWNRLTSFYEDSRRGPRMSEGLFLAFCIGGVIFPLLSLILVFPVMASMCNAINFIARRPLQARGPVRPR